LHCVHGRSVPVIVSSFEATAVASQGVLAVGQGQGVEVEGGHAAPTVCRQVARAAGS